MLDTQLFKRFWKLTIAPVLGVLSLLGSCVSDDWVSLGNNLIDSNSQFLFMDNLEVQLSTFKFDSVNTSGTRVALVGQHNDPILGNILANSYIPMGTNSLRIKGEDMIFDSLTLVIYNSGYFLGDTMCSTTIDIYRVLDEIRFNYNETALYSNRTFACAPQKLGSLTYLLIPSSHEPLEMRLSQEFGQELFGYLRLPVRPEVEDLGITNFFKGLHINVTTPTNTIVGYGVNDSSFVMRFHYHAYNSPDKPVSYEVKCNSTNRQFNHIETDKANTLINKLSEKPIVSDSTNNCAYILGAAGIYTRIEFPDLYEFYYSNPNYEIVKAQLEICPAREAKLSNIPNDLYVYYTNKNNDLVTQLADGSKNPPNGSLVRDPVFFDGTYYSWDITKFVINLANSNPENGEGLLLVPKNFNNTFEALAVANQNYYGSRTKLKLYILSHE